MLALIAMGVIVLTNKDFQGFAASLPSRFTDPTQKITIPLSAPILGGRQIEVPFAVPGFAVESNAVTEGEVKVLRILATDNPSEMMMSEWEGELTNQQNAREADPPRPDIQDYVNKRIFGWKQSFTDLGTEGGRNKLKSMIKQNVPGELVPLTNQVDQYDQFIKENKSFLAEPKGVADYLKGEKFPAELISTIASRGADYYSEIYYLVKVKKCDVKMIDMFVNQIMK
jgi:hypothetical protein